MIYICLNATVCCKETEDLKFGRELGELHTILHFYIPLLEELYFPQGKGMKLA